MDIEQLPVKSPAFDERYSKDITQLTIGGVSPKLKGSYTRKDMGDYITDIDNNSFLTFTKDTHTEIYDMLDSLASNPSSPFLFMYLGCGWIQEFIPPWEIHSDGGCVFDLQTALEWVSSLEDSKLVPDDALVKIKEVLVDSDAMVIKNLITVRNIVKEYGELKWSMTDIQKGYVDVDNPAFPKRRYELLSMLKTHNGILEFIYKPIHDVYVSVTTSLTDKSYPIDQFKAFWPFYTKQISPI